MSATRNTATTVAFTRPFQFRNMDHQRPAGNYVVETEEERIEELSFVAYRRTGAWIRLPPQPGVFEPEQLVPIDQDELEAALGAAAP
ncbi:hypothetical protein [Azospirillum sp. TSO35-2]|uniref:hypothetical protein n=1 Tax=Azospirillum sp. TSO35-2 TaxID=716796 RepID=UPI000D61BE4C|nr:hypothetical protein [Azospirillum sp. TSO35-2]PWC37873.1 hypothetical protein TSO352_10525 [Azospirillum sp. TSO35-2]